MGDTTVTVEESPDGEKPTTPDTVAETAVAAIGETARASATAESAAGQAQSASYDAGDSAAIAKEHADRATQAEQAIGQWATSITEAVSAIPGKIAETLQALVTAAPAAEPETKQPEPETPKTVTKPQGHWMNKKLWGKK